MSSFQLPAALLEAVRAAGRDGGGVAAFDADGTLWRDDVGEAFLLHLTQRGWVKPVDGQDAYKAYEAMVARDRATGYAFAAQLQAGLTRARSTPPRTPSRRAGCPSACTPRRRR